MYAVSDNIRYLHKLRHQAIIWFYYWINRCSQKKSYAWASFMMMLKCNPIVLPKGYANVSVAVVNL